MQKHSRTEFIDLRGLRHCVRQWGDPAAPKVFLLHGWMDSSSSFQFIVDALRQEWHLIAPDWRGYGQSEYLNRAYWFPDYYADLDALLQHYLPHEPARLVGHSMGANIASIYAGTRQGRVRQVSMLDFLGLNRSKPIDAPKQLDQWLESLTDKHQLRAYKDEAALARRLRQSNPRLTQTRADFLAHNVSRHRADGMIEMACDPWHKVPSPNLYRFEEVMSFWRNIACPVQLQIADTGFVVERFGTNSTEYLDRIGCFADLSVIRIVDASHNLQHDQPEQVAAALESFLQRD